jgi:hypothetical protein
LPKNLRTRLRPVNVCAIVASSFNRLGSDMEPDDPQAPGPASGVTAAMRSAGSVRIA